MDAHTIDAPTESAALQELAARYYVDLAAAFARGRLGDRRERDPLRLVAAGRAAGLRLHKFKRNATLPRVRKVLGILRGLGPGRLVDVGSGCGTFLWPLLDAFPTLTVCALDHDPRRVADLGAVRAGGIGRLLAARMDAECLALADDSADGVTILEVLEHLRRPERAVAEALRVARRFAIVSVPSKPDDNPEHLRLFTRDSLEALLLGAGARRVTIDYVPNHLLAIARI